MFKFTRNRPALKLPEKLLKYSYKCKQKFCKNNGVLKKYRATASKVGLMIFVIFEFYRCISPLVHRIRYFFLYFGMLPK